jgi:hypothetical protein
LPCFKLGAIFRDALLGNGGLKDGMLTCCAPGYFETWYAGLKTIAPQKKKWVDALVSEQQKNRGKP